MTDINSTVGAPRRDYSGAIYGSLLAASVIAGAGTGQEVLTPWKLAILLLVTGVVFWITHVYAHLVGGSHPHHRLRWETIRQVAAREWPIAQASGPPAGAAVAGMILGLTNATAGWLALAAAVAGQVGWAIAGAVATGAGRRVVALSAAVNLFLGLLIVVLKTLLAH
jgi:hypothetical protein